MHNNTYNGGQSLYIVATYIGLCGRPKVFFSARAARPAWVGGWVLLPASKLMSCARLCVFLSALGPPSAPIFQ